MGIVTGMRAPIAAGVALASLAVAESLARAAMTGRSAQETLALAFLALATTLPLLLLPAAGAAAAITAASVISLTLFHTLTVAGACAQLASLYLLAEDGEHRRSAELGSILLCVPFLVLAFAGSRPGSSEATFLSLLVAVLAPAAALGGIARKARREAVVQHAAREDIAGALLEHSALGERARIARELHDVVAHHISMVAVQAETARITTPGMPAAGARQLTEIGDTARAALAEMRQLVGVLRQDTNGDTAERRPQPKLADLAALIDEARNATGSATRLVLRGRPAKLDPAVELAAYRIAQEALTNARRYAAGAAVDVELSYNSHALYLRVRDNGPGPPTTPTPAGHGLTGMRERAAAVGGQLRTGPATGGGFLVEATLPTAIQLHE
jgi:signal transduction histidine kinase